MSQEISADIINGLKEHLDDHPVYAAVETLDDLRCFMEHHVYSVWDFMSLIKYLQSRLAPTQWPWVPVGDSSVRRFINELVLEEESDSTYEEGRFSSHFELYLGAMEEIGADTTAVNRFISKLQSDGLSQALASPDVPEPSRRFTETTFRFIRADSPHQVAAALALGREHIIPSMFRAILARIGVSERDAPIFHFYLNRHIHLDEDFHAPLSLKMLNKLCLGDTVRVEQAVDAAQLAVNARYAFWSDVHAAMLSRREGTS